VVVLKPDGRVISLPAGFLSFSVVAPAMINDSTSIDFTGIAVIRKI
jgi:hypothetical protein